MTGNSTSGENGEGRRDAPIGVFDSGIGGLTVAKEIMEQLPNERIVYFGDTARVPYGNKSRDTVVRYSEQIVRFLQTRQIKALVVACNTASAYAVDALEKALKIPLVDVVRPGANAALSATRNGKIGVIGTRGTVESGIYHAYIRRRRPGTEVTGKACPLFVPLVEEGLWEDPVTDEIARRYLSGLAETEIDTLILGCTHYPLIRSTIARVMGSGVTLVNPACETARSLKRILKQKGLDNPAPPAEGVVRHQFFVSDGADRFREFAGSIIESGILTAQVINIEEYGK